MKKLLIICLIILFKCNGNAQDLPIDCNLNYSILTSDTVLIEIRIEKKLEIDSFSVCVTNFSKTPIYLDTSYIKPFLFKQRGDTVFSGFGLHHIHEEDINEDMIIGHRLNTNHSLTKTFSTKNNLFFFKEKLSLVKNFRFEIRYVHKKELEVFDNIDFEKDFLEFSILSYYLLSSRFIIGNSTPVID